MCIINCEAPLKIMIENLCYFVKSQGSWLYKPEETNKFSLNVNKVMIQGEICSTAGFDNEIIILNDGTAKAKVTRDSQVPGEFSWLKPGVHCTVIGSLLCNGKLPHIAAIKISEITNEILCKMWLAEVIELKDILLNRISIELPGVQ